MSIKKTKSVTYQKFFSETSVYQDGGTEAAEFEYTVTSVSVVYDGSAQARCDVKVNGVVSQYPYSFNFSYKGGNLFKEAEAALKIIMADPEPDPEPAE
uniref:Phage protein n=1 Tax=Serratia phage Kevin TaxID=3161161 RepID=A0AAU8KYL5_9CAUD